MPVLGPDANTVLMMVLVLEGLPWQELHFLYHLWLTTCTIHAHCLNDAEDLEHVL